MIAPCGTFDYSVVVGRYTGAPQRWIGQARSLRDPSDHPGTAGKRPRFELAEGNIILRATESIFTFWLNPHFRQWGPPARYLSFEVGNTPAAVMEAGDQIAFHRRGTGDYALTIIRNETLVLGIGAITSLPLGSEIQVEEDARVQELHLYELARDLDMLDDLEAQVIWIDTGKGGLEAQLELLRRAPQSNHLIVAIKQSPGEREDQGDFWERIAGCRKAGRASYYVVGERFPDKRAWIDYVMQLPRRLPNDLHITFTTGGERIILCEGEEANIGSYYARVERVYRMGVPGAMSILAIGRLSRTLTKDMVIESVAFIRRC